MLTEESRKHPSFQLHMGTAVRDLIRAGDRVVGVQADGSDGPREFAADLVIGTDGRYSTVRKRGAFTELLSPQHFDILNFHGPLSRFLARPHDRAAGTGAGLPYGRHPDGRRPAVGGDDHSEGPIQERCTPLGRTGLPRSCSTAPRPTWPHTCGPTPKRSSTRCCWMSSSAAWRPGRPPACCSWGTRHTRCRPMGGKGSTWRCGMPWSPPITCARCSCAATTPPRSTPLPDRSRRQRMPEIVAIQEHQRKQTQTFLRSDRLSSRLAMRLLPLLAKSGLLPPS